MATDMTRGTDDSTTEGTPRPPDLHRRLYELETDIGRCVRYQAHRQSFFATLNRFILFGVLLTGSAAFARLFQEPEWFGAAAAVLAALSIVFTYSDKARDHQVLYWRYSELAADIVGVDVKEEQVTIWETRYKRILSDDPPPYRALNALCHNEVMIAQGQDDKYLVKLNFLQRSLVNVWRFRTGKFRPSIHIDA